MALLNRLPDDSMSTFGRHCCLELYCVAVKVGPMQLHNILRVTQCVMTIVQANRVFLLNIEVQPAAAHATLLFDTPHIVRCRPCKDCWLSVCASVTAKSRASVRLPRPS